MPASRLWMALGLVLAVAPAPARAASSPDGDRTTVQVRSVQEGGPVGGTAVLLAVDREAEEPVLFFASAARLFVREDGEPAVDPVRLIAAGGEAVTVQPDQILRPFGGASGVVLLRVAWTVDALTPIPIDFDEPSVGGVFMISGFMADGRPLEIAERVQFRATRLITGDRDVAGIQAPLGAPAISARGVFGIVTDAAAGRSPVVALLSPMRSFLTRHLPAAPQTEASSSARFEVAEKKLTGPLLSVGCDAINTGVIELNHFLTANEKPVDATASFLNATSLKLADLTVLGIDDRIVRLRFTMVGVPPPPFTSPVPCPEGQALVTVRVNLVVLPHQE